MRHLIARNKEFLLKIQQLNTKILNENTQLIEVLAIMGSPELVKSISPHIENITITCGNITEAITDFAGIDNSVS